MDGHQSAYQMHNLLETTVNQCYSTYIFTTIYHDGHTWSQHGAIWNSFESGIHKPFGLEGPNSEVENNIKNLCKFNALNATNHIKIKII